MAAESLGYLKGEKALAICGTETFWDGGSVSFTFTGEDGKKMIFVLTAENQRKEEKKFLSLYRDRHILLMPDSAHDEATILLSEKLAAGLAGGLQQKWPVFRGNAEKLCSLLKEGGHPKDLNEFHESAAKPTQRKGPTRR